MIRTSSKGLVRRGRILSLIQSLKGAAFYLSASRYLRRSTHREAKVMVAVCYLNEINIFFCLEGCIWNRSLKLLLDKCQVDGPLKSLAFVGIF